MKDIVVVGGGHAAGQLVDCLRKEGHEGSITLVGEEPQLPYQRPPLSKKYLTGELAVERVLFRPRAVYEKNEIDLRLGRRVEHIDRDAATVTLSDGETLRWDGLALTTGARVVTLPLPGVDLEGVFYLRTLADVDALRAHCAAEADMVVVGGGYIGLEVAASGRKMGMNVTVLEAADRVMARVAGAPLSGYYQSLHQRHGVDIRCGAQVSALVGDGEKVAAVKTADDETFPADVVVIGIGIQPNVELATAAGLACDNGIVVDDCAVTEDERIVAAGDCTFHPSRIYGRSHRLESVHNALEQARSAAAALCGRRTAYDQVPWFWSDQYDVKLQIAGVCAGHDDIVARGRPEDDKFCLFYLRGGTLIACDAVNSPAEFMAARKLVGADAAGDIDPDALADPDFPLKSLL